MAENLLGGRYQLLDVIGEGGMATVRKARDTALGRVVAVKVLRPQYASDAEFRERFRREAQSAAALSHPNIVNVYDVGQHDGANYIVMELVDGRPLSEIIATEGRISVDRAIDYGLGILDALEHAHANGVIHRDIKPHNILITRDGRVKVADFGIARAASASALTETGKVMGTVNYTSPEQARGDAATAQSDLYSTGLVLYEMLCGRPPFQGDTPVSVALKHVQEEPTPLSDICPSVPRNVERVIMKALMKKPDDRWRTARAFRNALAAAKGAIPPGGVPHTAPPAPHVTGGTPRSSPPPSSDLNSTRPFEAGGERDVPRTEPPDTGHKPKPKTKPTSGPRRRASVWAVVAVLLVALAGLGFGLWSAFQSWVQVEEVMVPDMVGLTVPEAEAAARSRSLQLDTSARRYDNTVEYNRIISQEPPGGSRRKVNSVVRVVVSLGPEMAAVPDLYNQTAREAQLALESFGFALGEQTTDYHEAVTEGRIIAQDPDAGAYVAKGTPVSVVLSAGPPPAPPEVPLVIGLSEDRARQAILDAGLTVGNITTRASMIYAPGTVVDQNPRPYITVEPGTAVDLVLAEHAGGDISTATPRRFAVTYRVEYGPDVQEIVIKVIDTFGERIAYGPASHRTGDLISQIVEVYGSGKIEVWVDGNLIRVDDV